MNSSKFALKITSINLLQIYDYFVIIATKILTKFLRILWLSVFSAHKIYKIILTLQVELRSEMTSILVVYQSQYVKGTSILLQRCFLWYTSSASPHRAASGVHTWRTVRQAIGEVQSLELHQYNIAMVLSTNLTKNKVFLHYQMVSNEILNHNLYVFVLTLI